MAFCIEIIIISYCTVLWSVINVPAKYFLQDVRETEKKLNIVAKTDGFAGEDESVVEKLSHVHFIVW